MPLGNYKRQLGNDEPLIIPMDSLNKTSTPAVNLNMPESTFGMIRQGTEKLRSFEVPFLPKTSALRYLPGELAAETERLIIPQSEMEAGMMVAPIGMVAKGIGKTPIGKKIAQVAQKEVPSVFQGFQDLTTKFLNYAKGKTTLSKQEIMDFARRPELKKGEADLLNRLGNEVKEAKIPAQEFAESLKRDLLPLKPVKVKEPQYRNITVQSRGMNMVSDAMNGKNYEEVVFESPITTNGSSHYPNSKNYFAHARGDEVVEGGKKIWREQEIQSDLLQKDVLEQKLLRPADQMSAFSDMQYHPTPEDTARAEKPLSQLSPFTNDRFGERIMRERIKEKASKGYEKYRLPTGNTISKIEGHDIGNWATLPEGGGFGARLKPEDLKIGIPVQHNNDIEYIVTDVLGEGRFKVVPMDAIGGMEDELRQFGSSPDDAINALAKGDKKAKEVFGSMIESETFDLTGKSNPQYRRYSDWGKFLKNKYGGKEIVDPQGNTWVEIALKPEYAKAPIEAFGLGLIPALKEQDENNQSTQKRISFLKKNQ